MRSERSAASSPREGGGAGRRPRTRAPDRSDEARLRLEAAPLDLEGIDRLELEGGACFGFAQRVGRIYLAFGRARPGIRLEGDQPLGLGEGTRGCEGPVLPGCGNSRSRLGTRCARLSGRGNAAASKGPRVSGRMRPFDPMPAALARRPASASTVPERSRGAPSRASRPWAMSHRPEELRSESRAAVRQAVQPSPASTPRRTRAARRGSVPRIAMRRPNGVGARLGDRAPSSSRSSVPVDHAPSGGGSSQGRSSLRGAPQRCLEHEPRKLGAEELGLGAKA
jgi:hypothetical protein